MTSRVRRRVPPRRGTRQCGQWVAAWTWRAVGRIRGRPYPRPRRLRGGGGAAGGARRLSGFRPGIPLGCPAGSSPSDGSTAASNAPTRSVSWLMVVRSVARSASWRASRCSRSASCSRWRSTSAINSSRLVRYRSSGVAIAAAYRFSSSLNRYLTSAPSRMKCGVETLELDTSIAGREAPVDARSSCISRRDPGRHLPLHGAPVTEAAIQALPLQRTQLDLGHVQPTAMLGGVVDLQPVSQALGLGWREGLVERGGRVRVEVVHDQHDLLGVGIVDVDQLLDAVGEVDPGALRAHSHLPPPP